SASITILGTTYHNLTITGGNTKTAGGNITLNGNLAVESSSTFDGLSSSVTFNGTNTLSTADAGTFQFNDVIINSTKSLDAGSISILVKGNWTNNGTFSGSGSSTVTFNGSSQQTSKSVFNNLTISSSGTVTATGNLRINGNFNINSGTFAAGTTSDTLKGNFTRSGGTIDPSTSTFVLNGSSGQTLSGATFNNVLVNNSNNISLGSNLTVNGTLTISSGDILTGDENGVILGANGSLSESAGNTVVGKTTTMRNLNTIGTTYTLGNIGIEISTASVLPGTTTITRYTGTSLNGGGSFSSNSSIERYFNVAPTTNSGLNVSITFRYDELELTDHSENTLSLWRSSNSGTTWTGLGGTANAGDNSVTVAGVNSLGYITAADVNHPLQPNSLTARVYRDADGKSSTSNDWYGKKWFIQLRRTDTNGEIVGQVNGDSILIIDTLSAGTYVALVSDSAGWYHLSNRVNSGTIDSSSVSSKSISISGGTSNLVEFMNFHPGKITVRKYLDNDGNFSTSDDRSGKKWHLVIYKGSVSAQNIQRQVTSDSILVDSLLGDGNYIIEEKDSIGWVHLGYISSDSTVENTTNQVLMTITDGQTKFVNFVNRVNLNSIVIEKYLDVDVNFATSGDRQEKRWHLTVRRGSLSGDIVAQVDSSRLVVSGLEPNQTYYAIEADTLGWRPLGLIFKQNGNVVDSSENSSKSVQITFTGGGNTATVQFINSNADSAYFITFSQTTDPAGWGKGGSKVAKILKKAPTKPPTAKKPIIKPTIGNILDTVFSKIYGKLSVRANIVPSLVGLNEKKIPNGLYLGVPSEALNSNLKARADTAVFMFTKDAKAFRSFVNHDGSARGFDGNNKSAEWNLVRSNSKKPSKFKGVVKAKNPKDGTNNKLAGELAALRMNMALYASGVLPSGYTGFKSLIFDMGNDSLNVLNGKTIEQLALIVDTALTFWTRYYSNRYPTSNAFYETLHVSLTRINKAFLDTVDSNDFVLNDNAIQWYSPLKLRSGIGKPLYLSPFLRSTGKSTTSDVVNTLQSNTPSKFELYQNYPNPFNPTTTIEYYLPTSAFVTLKIFNVLGQEVATVLNNKLVEEGYDEISVDASRLSSGVYYYRLAAIQSNNNVDEFDREFVQTKKFIVIK
ncbi:MAG: T9SS type A sorting domain-containing protein, partial [Ignavibacteriales bacterium]|nr:T9SS type A sorting domain-containing protein [Ignavibacteriales bacterium]